MTVTPTHPTRTLRRTLLVVIGLAAIGVALIAFQVVGRAPTLAVVLEGDLPFIRIAGQSVPIEEARWTCAPEHRWLHTLDRRQLERVDWAQTVEVLLPGATLDRQLNHTARGDSIPRGGRSGPSLTAQTARIRIRRPDGFIEPALVVTSEIRSNPEARPRTFLTIVQGVREGGPPPPIDAEPEFRFQPRPWLERLRGLPEYEIVFSAREVAPYPERRPPG